jgi:hypothetical protein
MVEPPVRHQPRFGKPVKSAVRAIEVNTQMRSTRLPDVKDNDRFTIRRRRSAM